MLRQSEGKIVKSVVKGWTYFSPTLILMNKALNKVNCKVKQKALIFFLCQAWF